MEGDLDSIIGLLAKAQVRSRGDGGNIGDCNGETSLFWIDNGPRWFDHISDILLRDHTNKHQKITWSIGSLGDGAMAGDCDVAFEDEECIEGI